MPYIEFKKTYQSREDKKTYKAGEVIEVDHDNFIELISIGVAAATEKERPLNVLLKSISKMNKEELLKFAEENDIGVNWQNINLIRKSIERELMKRGDKQ